ncbi:hypothetical protein GCM10027456_82920 [Kineosporia babensis]
MLLPEQAITGPGGAGTLFAYPPYLPQSQMLVVMAEATPAYRSDAVERPPGEFRTGRLRWADWPQLGQSLLTAGPSGRGAGTPGVPGVPG